MTLKAHLVFYETRANTRPRTGPLPAARRPVVAALNLAPFAMTSLINIIGLSDSFAPLSGAKLNMPATFFGGWQG